MTLCQDFYENLKRLQVLVPANTIFVAEPTNDFTLVSCMVSPGFDFRDFELFEGPKLAAKYPEHSQIIRRINR